MESQPAAMQEYNFFQDANVFANQNSRQLDSEFSSEHVSPAQQESSNKRKSRCRSSLACIACRSRHLKCDAIKPVCSRCQLDEKECVYAVSRRGGKRRQDTSGAKQGFPGLHSSAPNINHANPALSMNSSSNLIDPTSTVISTPRSASSHYSQQKESIDPARTLKSYYENFHDPHPFMLPQWSFQARLRTNKESLQHVLPVLEYIGSIYEADEQSLAYRQAAHAALTSEGHLPSNGFSVQALLLFAVALHCSDEYEAADAFLDRAIDIAVNIQMNHHCFVHREGEGDPILQESWRRTFWTLFVMDGLFAAINHRTSHRLRSVISDVELPCEDDEYESGSIPQPKTLARYDNKEFEPEDVYFSSYTYLIDAGRHVSDVLGLNVNVRDARDSRLASADAQVVNWNLYLPKSKQSVMHEHRKIDETMFLAHLVINTSKLIIHRPHSQLLYNNIEAESKCTPPYFERKMDSVHKNLALHTLKSMEAIDAGAKLLALSSQPIKHSPLFVCCLALITMAQVSACKNVLEVGSSSYMAGRERIRLALGVLNIHEKYWGLARRSIREVKGVARQLLSVPTLADSTGPELVGGSIASFEDGSPGDASENQIMPDLMTEPYLDFRSPDLVFPDFEFIE